jgi:hypothetical protein
VCNHAGVACGAAGRLCRRIREVADPVCAHAFGDREHLRVGGGGSFFGPGTAAREELAARGLAAWNDGDAGLIPELLLMLMWEPPLEVVGSGKFTTPCERIHDENLIPAAARFEALLLGLLGLLDDPQPAITSTPDTTATATATATPKAIGTRWRPGEMARTFHRVVPATS